MRASQDIHSPSHIYSQGFTLDKFFGLIFFFFASGVEGEILRLLPSIQMVKYIYIYMYICVYICVYVCICNICIYGWPLVKKKTGIANVDHKTINIIIILLFSKYRLL